MTESTNVTDIISIVPENIKLLAERIFDEIRVKKGLRKGNVYKTSKESWRTDENGMIYYVWRKLSFRIGNDIKLPLQSKKYLNDLETSTLDDVVEYIGLKYFHEEYDDYMNVKKSIEKVNENE